jgi:TolB protein
MARRFLLFSIFLPLIFLSKVYGCLFSACFVIRPSSVVIHHSAPHLHASRVPNQSPGQFQRNADIGGPQLAGSAKYDPATQEYTLSGAGTNMWFGRDQFHFLSRPMKGDFILRTRIEFLGKGAVNHRKVGWMVRPNLEPDAPYADCAEHGDGLTSLQFRRAAATNTEQITLHIGRAHV